MERSPRFVMLFGLGLAIALAGFGTFLWASYEEYQQGLVQLSPGETEPLFFTLNVVLVMIMYSVIVVVLALALGYSWRSYHTLSPVKPSEKEQLAALRAKSPFFRKN